MNQLDGTFKQIDEEQLKKELDALIKHYNECVGTGGKARQFRDEDTKMKDRVVKSIQRAVKRLKKFENSHPHFNHFDKALRPINSFSQSYKPEKNIPWTIE